MSNQSRPAFVFALICSANFWISGLLLTAFFTQNQWFSWLMLLPDPLARIAMFFYSWFLYVPFSFVVGTGIAWLILKILPDSIPTLIKGLISVGSAILAGVLCLPFWRFDSGSSTFYAQQAARQQDLQEVLDIQLHVMQNFNMEREAEALIRRGAQPEWQNRRFPIDESLLYEEGPETEDSL